MKAKFSIQFNSIYFHVVGNRRPNALTILQNSLDAQKEAKDKIIANNADKLDLVVAFRNAISFISVLVHLAKGCVDYLPQFLRKIIDGFLSGYSEGLKQNAVKALTKGLREASGGMPRGALYGFARILADTMKL